MTDKRQSDTTMDVTAILTADHREMIELIEQIESTTDPKQRRQLADAVTAEVMRHSVAEELFVYPEVVRHVPGGADEVEHDKEEHDELVVVMKKLENVDSSDESFMTLVAELKGLLEHHADDEESGQFPKLRENLTAEKLADMGKRVEAAKVIAPTRPHPTAPHSELFHMTIGPGVGMVDRLRDALSGRLTP